MVFAAPRSQASLDHRGIVKMFGFVASPAMCVMEYMPDGQLDNFLATQIDISYAKRAEILLEVASGLAYLHRMGVVHVRHPSACAKCMACFTSLIFTCRKTSARLSVLARDDGRQRANTGEYNKRESTIKGHAFERKRGSSAVCTRGC